MAEELTPNDRFLLEQLAMLRRDLRELRELHKDDNPPKAEKAATDPISRRSKT